VRTDHKSRYQGKNLLYLLFSLGIPILLLYFSLTASIAQKETSTHIRILIWTADIFGILFYISQFLAAGYLQRVFFPAPRSKIVAILIYVCVFLGAFFCSVCGAVACEAFGYNLFLRVMRR
jgi:hypothetical protein